MHRDDHALLTQTLILMSSHTSGILIKYISPTSNFVINGGVVTRGLIWTKPCEFSHVMECKYMSL